MNIINFGNGTILEHGYGIVAKDVLADKDFNINSKVLYAYLCSYANNKNKAFPFEKKNIRGFKYKHKKRLQIP